MNEKITSIHEFAKHKSALPLREDILYFIQQAREMLKILNEKDGIIGAKDDIDILEEKYKELYDAACLTWHFGNQSKIDPRTMEKLRRALVELDGKDRPVKNSPKLK